MMSRRLIPKWAMLGLLLSALLAGCLINREQNTPTVAGLNTNNLVDPIGQSTAPASLNKLQTRAALPKSGSRNVLCLSGGGADGAYSVGVICGWTCRGDRPCFDVVTGISTGALIAPYAFLGSGYDAKIRELYTNTDDRDIYRSKPVTGIFSESFASNRPLARKLKEHVDADLLTAIAREHAKGRRLYIGTTEMEGHRFIVWDIGAIASQGRPEDLELVRSIMLASTSIPGIFPPIRIPVTVNNQPYCEMHVDGSVSQSVFFLPPTSVKGQSETNVYVVIAGKLYADPEKVNPRAYNIALENLQGFSYAHTRSDVFRIWTNCASNGFSFQLTAIPAEFSAPATMSSIDKAVMQQLYHEGVRQIMSGAAWRTTPPGHGPGEDTLIRSSNELIQVPRTQAIVSQP